MSHLPEEFLCANVGANNIASILVTTPQGHILIDTGTEKMAAVIFPNMEDGKPYQILFGGPPTPITGDPKYDTRPQDAFDSYKALRAMNPDILITGHPQNLLKGKLDALWANKRPSPLAMAPGQWKKMVDDSEANFRKRLAEAAAATR